MESNPLTEAILAANTVIGPAVEYAGRNGGNSVLHRLLRLDRSTGPLRRSFPCHRATDNLLSTSGYRSGQTVEIPGASRLPLLPEGLATHNAYAVKPHVPALKIRNQCDRTRLLRQLSANRTRLASMGAHPRGSPSAPGRCHCVSMPEIVPADTWEHWQSQNVCSSR